MSAQIVPQSMMLDPVELALSESHHRIKNDLQLLASWAAQAVCSAEDPKAALRSMAGRIGVVGRLHDKLRTADGKVELGEELRSFGLDIGSLADVDARHVQVVVCADSGLLPAPKARTLLLIVHELAVNALKHGFGPGGGGLYIRYTRRGAGHTIVVASEHADPAPAAPVPSDGGRGRGIVAALVKQIGGSILQYRTARGWRVEITWADAPQPVEVCQGEAPLPGRTVLRGGFPPHLAA